MRQADQSYELGEYNEAAMLYKKAYSKTEAKEKEKRAERAFKTAECYRRSHRAMTDYAARAAQPLTGTVFSDLADLQKQNCTHLARLLGRMDS